MWYIWFLKKLWITRFQQKSPQIIIPKSLCLVVIFHFILVSKIFLIGFFKKNYWFLQQFERRSTPFNSTRVVSIHGIIGRVSGFKRRSTPRNGERNGCGVSRGGRAKIVLTHLKFYHASICTVPSLLYPEIFHFKTRFDLILEEDNIGAHNNQVIHMQCVFKKAYPILSVFQGSIQNPSNPTHASTPLLYCCSLPFSPSETIFPAKMLDPSLPNNIRWNFFYIVSPSKLVFWMLADLTLFPDLKKIRIEKKMGSGVVFHLRYNAKSTFHRHCDSVVTCTGKSLQEEEVIILQEEEVILQEENLYHYKWREVSLCIRQGCCKMREEGSMGEEVQTHKSWQYMQVHAGLHSLYCIVHGMYGWQHLDRIEIYVSFCRGCTYLFQLHIEESGLWLAGARPGLPFSRGELVSSSIFSSIFPVRVSGIGLSRKNFVYKGLTTQSRASINKTRSLQYNISSDTIYSH
ncbi:hypothetical protein VP01_28g4 [Puccinia sorghi]|uniref:Uncharacterized protein n=1 Tax=Puccinia sorghi TaxID=27349 RepID=A0A0L6V1F1_9BASI|nr:hypothetical protein VP01_28g4 [Puccinia sorghi]